MGTSLIVMALGFAIIAAFGYVNMVLQPRWYPGDMPGDRASLRKAGAAKSTRNGRMILGLVQLGLFLVGAGLVTASAAVVATTLGYGGG